MQQKPHVSIIYLDSIDRTFFGDFETEVEHDKLELKIHERPEPGPYAAVEWFLPTAIIAFVAKAYFQEFLKDMGSDHYKALKSSLAKLTKKTISQPRFEPVLMGTKGKVRQNNPYSMAYSIMAEGKDGYNFKLLIPKFSPDIDYENIVVKFMEFIAEYHVNGHSAASLEIEKSGSPGGIILVHVNPETGVIEWLDHVPPEVRERMAAQRNQ
ncbi:hypothetical protein ACET96_06075 [Aeromonas dhakensis]|uniref:hypothetical protein n=1 Tax=Aeromonas TaxID=642 RepID=UPI0005A7F88C|nr:MULTISPECIES: hypothetical protein [Aeromonas]ELM3752832.1 hypothetical protein [Aeromonas dhakensis]UBH57172.1 hypothetical protein LA341_04425 [Aeromonas enteropelogenes]